MEADVLICESARVADQKLYILGGAWDLMLTDDPVVAIALAGTIHATAEDEGDHLVQFVLCDAETGQPVQLGHEGDLVSSEATLAIREPQAPGEWPTTNPFAANFVGVPLPAGAYRFEVRVDGQTIGGARFRVVRLPELP